MYLHKMKEDAKIRKKSYSGSIIVSWTMQTLRAIHDNILLTVTWVTLVLFFYLVLYFI